MNKKQMITFGIVVLVLLGGVFAYSKLSNSEDESEQPKGKISGDICTMDYNPVCGVNNITYGNRCMAQETEIAYEGECGSNSASGTFLVNEVPNNLTEEELAVA